MTAIQSARAERLERIARDLGEAVALSDDTFTELLPDLVRGGNRAWAFGHGLASVSPDRRATWARLVEGLERIALEQRNVQVLRGFLAELWDEDRDLASTSSTPRSNNLPCWRSFRFCIRQWSSMIAASSV